MVWTPDTRRDYARRNAGYASSISDREWGKLTLFMPPKQRRGRPRTTDLRATMDAIFYLLQSGCQWDMIPKDFPPWQTVYRYFRTWMRDGTWARIHDALYRQCRDLEGRELSPSVAIIDAQSSKTGPDARGHVGYDAGKKVKGRKRHIVVDTLGLMLTAAVHSAGIQDRDGAALALENLTARFPFIDKIFADGGYRGPVAQANSPGPLDIIKRSDKTDGFVVLSKRWPKRWIIERTFAWLGINRRLSKDFERFAETTLAAVQIRCIALWANIS